MRLEQKLFDGHAVKMVLPSVDGEMCILSNHISIITLLKKGMIKIFKQGVERPVIIDTNAGICSFFNNTATVLLLHDT